MRSLNDIIDQEYENDDGEIICQLEREIRERDAVICEMWRLLSLSTIAYDSIPRDEALERHHDFVKSLGTDYEPLEEPEPDFLEDDEITCDDCLAWASETTSAGHLSDCKYWPEKEQ